MSSREKLLAIALLILVFVSGALSAAAVVRITSDDDRRDGFRDRQGGPPPGAFGPPGGRGGQRSPVRLAPGLLAELNLDEEQATEIRSVLEQHREMSEAILEGVQPALRAQLDTARAAVRAVLSPEQQEIYDRYLEEHRSIMEDRFGRSRGGSRGGRGR
jgi:hypothetical protein